MGQRLNFIRDGWSLSVHCHFLIGSPCPVQGMTGSLDEKRQLPKCAIHFAQRFAGHLRAALT